MLQLDNREIMHSLELPLELPIDEEVTLQLLTPSDIDERFKFEQENASFHTQYSRASSVKTKPGVAWDLATTWLHAEEGKVVPYKVSYLGRYAGEVMFHSRSSREHPVTKMSYRLAEDLQGRNIATRAAARLRDLGFTQLGLATILLDIRSGNLASKGVARRIGAYRVEDREGLWADRVTRLFFPIGTFELWRIDKDGR